MISTITITVVSLLTRFSLDSFGEGALLMLLTKLIPLIVGLLIFTAMYHWIPNIKVKWRSALWAALFASFAW